MLPLMNGKIIPDDYIDDLGIYNFFENTVAIGTTPLVINICFLYTICIFEFIKFDNKNVSSTLVYLVYSFYLTNNFRNYYSIE